MRRGSWVVSLPLALLPLMASCDGDRHSVQAHGEPSPSESEIVMETATPRGLAAGLLAHFQESDVLSFGGAEERGGFSVMVDIDDPDIETVHLFIQVEPDLGALPCGTDSFYRSVSCKTTAGSTTEVLVRVSENSKMPVVEGTFYDVQRKNVLVQVWGTRARDAKSLVRDLLRDSMLGAVTSAELNEQGEQLDDFEHLESVVRVTTG